LKATDVRTVVIAGKVVMRDRWMLTLDENEILAKAEKYKKQITSSLATTGASESPKVISH
jgi:hypothetical protein